MLATKKRVRKMNSSYPGQMTGKKWKVDEKPKRQKKKQRLQNSISKKQLPLNQQPDSTVTDQIEPSVHTINTSTSNNEDNSISASTKKVEAVFVEDVSSQVVKLLIEVQLKCI